MYFENCIVTKVIPRVAARCALDFTYAHEYIHYSCIRDHYYMYHGV